MTYVCNDPCWRAECMCWTNPFCISTGPWGAWRAGIGEMVTLYLSGFEKPVQRMQKMRVIQTWYPGISEPLDAVGWSP